MNKAVYGTKIFLKKNSATILSVLGAAGVVATSVMAVKATPKALELISEAEKEKGDKLEVMESVRVAAPVYIPAALVGVGTIACIFGANALNKRTQASLISAYGLLEQSFKEYRHYSKEVFGGDADTEIREAIVQDKYSKINPTSIIEGKHQFYDMYSGRFFECTLADAYRAEYKLNQGYCQYGYASLNDFYDLLGLDRVEGGDDIGWCVDISDHYGYSSIEFEHELVHIDDGLGETVQCYVIVMPYDPTPDYLC